MIKLIRKLVPENNISFADVLSFKTENHVGFWNEINNSFLLFPDWSCTFECSILPDCGTFEELDEAVYQLCEEHIDSVSYSSAYAIRLERE